MTIVYRNDARVARVADDGEGVHFISAGAAPQRPAIARIRLDQVALIRLAVFLLPITGLAGIASLGELKGSASVYVFLLAIPFALAKPAFYRTPLPRALLLFFGCLAGWIAITAAVNIETIATASHFDRSALNKAVTSSLVVAFGMLITLVCLQAMQTLDQVERVFLKPLVAAVAACALFAIPEVWSWFSPIGEIAYRFTTGLVHTADDEEGRIAGRLISLAFEAPDLSYFCGMAAPWMLLASRLKARHRHSFQGRLFAYWPLLMCLGLIALSNSRTGLVMLAGMIGMECVYWLGLRRMRLPPTGTAIMVLLACVIAGTMMLWSTAASWSVQDTADVSTTSRLALLLSQLAIFSANPFFGVGLGQFGFHAANYLPGWAWDSYEIVQWFDKLQDLPPSFNVTGRIGAELGLPGLVIWYGFWTWAMLRIVRSASRLRASPRMAYLNVAMLGSIGALLMGGISNDAFRRPETWILIAILTLWDGRSVETVAPRAG